jgi:hypothetical protein
MQPQAPRLQGLQSKAHEYRREEQQAENDPEESNLEWVQGTGYVAHEAVHGRRHEGRQQHGQHAPERARLGQQGWQGDGHAG